MPGRWRMSEDVTSKCFVYCAALRPPHEGLIPLLIVMGHFSTSLHYLSSALLSLSREVVFSP